MIEESSIHEFYIRGIARYIYEIHVCLQKAPKKNKSTGTVLPLKHYINAFCFLKDSAKKSAGKEVLLISWIKMKPLHKAMNLVKNVP